MLVEQVAGLRLDAEVHVFMLLADRDLVLDRKIGLNKWVGPCVLMTPFYTIFPFEARLKNASSCRGLRPTGTRKKCRCSETGANRRALVECLAQPEIVTM